MRILSTTVVLFTAASVLLTSTMPPARAHVHVEAASGGATQNLHGDEDSHAHGHRHGPRGHRHDRGVERGETSKRSTESDHGGGDWHLHVVLLGLEFPLPCKEPGEHEEFDGERFVRLVEEQATPTAQGPDSCPEPAPAIDALGLVVELHDSPRRLEGEDAGRFSLCDAARFERSGVLLI